MQHDRDMPTKNIASVKVFRVTWWRLAIRVLMILIMLLLNYAMAGSTVDHYRTGAPGEPHLMTDLISILVLLFFDLTVLLPSLFQISSIESDPQEDGIVVTTLLWRRKLKWSQIIMFNKPVVAGFVIMRTRLCLYLIAARDFVQFEELVRLIDSKLKLTLPEPLHEKR